MGVASGALWLFYQDSLLRTSSGDAWRRARVESLGDGSVLAKNGKRGMGDYPMPLDSSQECRCAVS
jgi:hypothetical protein